MERPALHHDGIGNQALSFPAIESKFSVAGGVVLLI